MLALFDSHCHLDVAEFAGDRAQVLARARAAGVVGQLIPAIDRAHWPALAQLVAEHTDLHAAYGLHPMYLDPHSDADMQALPEWISRNRPSAIGECGLDFFVPGLDPDRQRAVFQRHLELAREFDLPLVIHARRAVEEVIANIRRVGGLRGVIHSYPGSAEQARQLHALGFKLGIGGPVTFERAQRLRRLVTEVPLDWLVLETDAPDQPCAQHRGLRNEPAYLTVVLEEVARLRGCDEAIVAEATTANARQLFRLAAA